MERRTERGKGTRQEEPLILRLAGYANKSVAKTKMAPSMAMMMCSRMWQKKETERDRERGKGAAEEKATEDAFVVVVKLLTHTGNDWG